MKHSTVADSDTIAAFATALGGPVGIIRISGDRAMPIAAMLWHGNHALDAPPYRTLHLGKIATADEVLDDRALAVAMPSPHSYTGEDVVELHCHGGALASRLILQELLRCGCRHAEPGEFTRRAFLNGRIDLTQAEAVADLIEAHSERAVHLANRQLEGSLRSRVETLADDIMTILAECEARLDFVEEELDWRSAMEMNGLFALVLSTVDDLLRSRREGEILRHGLHLVLAGPTNVGKSSLLNAILGRDRAIVTDIPGTTRDTLEEFVHVRGIPLKLIDTAGIRDTADVIERFGMKRSVDSMRGAHLVLWVFDASQPYEPQACPLDTIGGQLILVGNKADLRSEPTPPPPPDLPEPVYTCALTGMGLTTLFDAIEKAALGDLGGAESEVAVSARHAALLEAVRLALVQAQGNVGLDHMDLASIALREALDHVGRITGRTVEPDVLDTIFSRFCIGK